METWCAKIICLTVRESGASHGLHPVRGMKFQLPLLERYFPLWLAEFPITT